MKPKDKLPLKPSEYKKARQAAGTQKDVAEALGIDRSTIVRREAGDVPITKEAAIALISLPTTSLPIGQPARPTGKRSAKTRAR